MPEKHPEPERETQPVPSHNGLAPQSVPDKIADESSPLPRILLLIEKRGNRTQVARQMRRYSKLLIPDKGSLPEEGFDLAIVDRAGLKRWSSELTQARECERPVFLPVMLILSRADMRQRNRLSVETIDEFITTPIDPEEFFERSAMMLRARQFAVKQRKDLFHAVNYDGSTGLPNRDLFLYYLEAAMRHEDYRAEKLYVVAFRMPMKLFAQSLGQGAIEEIVQAIFRDLKQEFDDRLVMTRFSGAQGAMQMPIGWSLSNVSRCSRQLIEVMQRPRLIRGDWVRPTASMGVASFPDDATDATALLEAAIRATNEAPRTGTPNFYAPVVQDRAMDLLRMETALHQALEQQEFELWYQPKFRLSDLTMVGAEALIRWRKPSGEKVSPGVFIPVAEQAGLVQRIDSWVIETACAALARWRQSGLDCPRIAVNVTAADLAVDGFVSWIKQLIADYGLTPSSIGVEVTETMLMNVDQNNQDILEALRGIGIRVSIDDFGTGYSSLSYLQHLPVDVLKIDKSFVDHIPHNQQGLKITNAIIALGEQFGLELIAEGIETHEQLEYLRERGVQSGQGYLVSRPLPESEFIDAMKNGLSNDTGPEKCPTTREKPDESSLAHLNEHSSRKLQKYKSAFEQSRDAINFMTREGFTDCNPAALAMFRVPDRATFVSLHPGDLSPAYQSDGRPSQEAAADFIDEALSQGQVFFEWCHRTWDGVDFSTEILLSRIDMDDGEMVQAIVRDISDRKEARILPAREQELAEVQRLAHLGNWICDLRTNQIQCSDEVYRIYGLSPGEGATHESLLSAVHPNDRSKVQAAIKTASKDESYEVEHRIMRPNGEVRTVLERGYRDHDVDGKPLRMFGTIQDITDQRRLEVELRKEKTLSESILSRLPGIFYIYNEQGHLIKWNDRLEAVTGFSPEELDDIDGQALVPQEEKSRIAGAIAKVFSEGSMVIESKLRTVEGDIPYLFNGLRVKLNDQSYLLGIGLDIARQKQLEASLEREATTDTLTGLYNRQRFNTEMERALALYARYDTETTLVMIDLDHFKRVNDTYGHNAGDKVLVELTARLAKEMREPDFLARWGGEEFMALLPETDLSGAARVAEKLRQRIEVEPFPEVGILTISMGITNIQNGDTPNTLLERVDAALYEAKRGGRNRVVVGCKDPGIPQLGD